MRNPWLIKRYERIGHELQKRLKHLYLSKDSKIHAKDIYNEKERMLRVHGMSVEEIEKYMVEIVIHPTEFAGGVAVRGTIDDIKVRVKT
jgi:hypothetical protein